MGPRGITVPQHAEEAPPRSNINCPEAVLRCLVFPFLDSDDLVRPVCKLWTHAATCDLLWKSLYRCRFSAPCTRWATEPYASNWKAAFRSEALARLRLRGKSNGFGWKARTCPVLGCHKELQSALERDTHTLQHEEAYYLYRAKLANKRR